MPPFLSSLKRVLTYTVLGTVILTSASCSWLKSIEDPTKDWSADKLYAEARDNFNSHNWETARSYYQKIEARYPYGRYAQQAQIETAYSYYKEQEPAQCIQICDRFLRQYPEHPLSPYAMYLKGMATLDEDDGWMSWIVKQDLSQRDSVAARDAFDIFKELVERFPRSRYANDARDRMYELISAQARYEVNTARYYLKRDAYIAAINRSQTVLRDFQSTDQAIEALEIMEESYKKLNMPEKAADVRRILDANQNRPSMKNYKQAQAEKAQEAPAP